MYADKLALQFHGFHPSDFTVEYVNTILEDIQEEAPYGATTKAHFARQGHDFRGVIEIHSRAGTFFARAQGTRLKEVGRRLTEQIRRQLDRWKSERFKLASAF